MTDGLSAEVAGAAQGVLDQLDEWEAEDKTPDPAESEES